MTALPHAEHATLRLLKVATPAFVPPDKWPQTGTAST